MITLPIEQWCGLAELQRVANELAQAVRHRVPEDIALALCRAQAAIDWFQVANCLDLDRNHIEAEIDRLDSVYEQDTLPGICPPPKGIP